MNKKETFQAALKHFKTNDKVLYKGIKHISLEPLQRRKKLNAYTHLLRSIISQQISTKAADSILKKFLTLFPNEKIDFEVLASRTDEDLKSVGISPQKMRYMRDLTEKIVSGQLVPIDKLKKMSDQEIIDHLIQVKGIGEWTVQMLLIFFLHRQDVMPVRDLGVQNGYKIVFNKRKRPSEKEILKMSKKWKPYSSVAALYLWRAADEKK